MKPVKLVFAVFAIILVQSVNVFANELRGQEGGGGDPCENSILRIQSDLRKWISEKGYERLSLPLDYAHKITKATGAQAACKTGSWSPGIPICRLAPKVARIECNRDAFNSLDTPARYEEIYRADLLLAQLIENPDEDGLSRQIKGLLIPVKESRLAIRDKNEQEVLQLGNTDYDIYLRTKAVIQAAVKAATKGGDFNHLQSSPVGNRLKPDTILRSLVSSNNDYNRLAQFIRQFIRVEFSAELNGESQPLSAWPVPNTGGFIALGVFDVFMDVLSEINSVAPWAPQGDAQARCKKTISEIRDDIGQWLETSGPNGLLLSAGQTHQSYRASMGFALDTTRIKCQPEPVNVESVEKVCMYAPHGKRHIIVCNQDAFLGLNISEKYRLIHHEFAGVAGIEKSSGSASVYKISDQVEAYLKEFVEFRLSRSI